MRAANFVRDLKSDTSKWIKALMKAPTGSAGTKRKFGGAAPASLIHKPEGRQNSGRWWSGGAAKPLREIKIFSSPVKRGDRTSRRSFCADGNDEVYRKSMANPISQGLVPPHHPMGFGLLFALYPRVSFALLTPHRGYFMPPRHAARLTTMSHMRGNSIGGPFTSTQGGGDAIHQLSPLFSSSF